jgi:hypothetical protein
VKKEDVLLAPVMALQMEREEGTPANERTVLLKKGDDYVPHKVTIGLSNFKEAEILSGLEPGSVLGVLMTSRLKQENEQMEDRIRSSRSFGTTGRQRSR